MVFPALPPAARLGRFAQRGATIVLAFASGIALHAGTLLPGTPANFVESGTPNFVVLRQEGLGLTASPTDLHLLPDGRLLIVSPRELTLGDGVRWETYQRDPETAPVDLDLVAVDADGSIYAGIPNHFARIEFGANGRWRYVAVADFPSEPTLFNRSFVRVGTAGGAWLWHAGSGPVVAWKPGTTARLVGTINHVERTFSAAGRGLVCDSSSGALYVLSGDRLERLPVPAMPSVDQVTTCAIELADGRTLMGTNSVGARVLAGDRLDDFTTPGPLDGRYRINDLCALAGGQFAAALDHLGIAFFDPQGRLTGAMDRSAQHQFARTRRLLAGPGGNLWALLSDGVACINFPSQVSNFDIQISTGTTFALLYRHQGVLWLGSDGRIQRAVYDDDGRLLRFDLDGPAGYINSLCTAFDRLVACGREGIYVHEPEGWSLVVPGITNAHVAIEAEPDGRHVYVARDEIGLISFEGARPVVTRVPVPELGDPYVGVQKAGGEYWTELGSGRVARIQVHEGTPVARIFGTADGLRDSWAQLFIIDEVARFNLAGHVMRLDHATQRFVADGSLVALSGGPIAGHGRPARDAAGRLWFAYADTVRVAGLSPGETAPRLPNALTPLLFTMQDDGVVWLHQAQKLLRFDPAITAPESAPFRAVISRVQLVTSNRYLFQIGDRLPTLDFADNTVAFHFLAPAAMFREATTFEVLLEGGGDTWIPTGTAGSAAFNGLKEGDYVLRVRPRSGALVGGEDVVAFTVRAPWYRTWLAYISYGVSTVLVVLLVAWMLSYLERREKARLEKVVTRRTAELHEANAQLARQVDETLRSAGNLRTSEERFRRLNEELEARVEARTAELHAANDNLLASYQELESFSYSISHDLRAPLRNIRGFADILRKRFAGRLGDDGDRYLRTVGNEAVRLGRLIDSLLGFSRLGRAPLQREQVDLAAVVQTVREELESASPGAGASWRIGPLPTVEGDATLLRQVFANLMGNAVKFSAGRQPPVIEIGANADAEQPGGRVFFVRDNGVGFDPRYVDKLFGVFQRLHSSEEFDGSGIGLANVRRIIMRHGGRVWAEGVPGSGATFYFTVPAGPPPAGPTFVVSPHRER